MRRLLVVAFVMVMCPPALGAGFVQRSGPDLMMDGHPYVFTGLNVYNANSNGLCWYAFDPASLEASLASIGPGKGVIRAWFFQQLATTNGVRDWSRFDRTLAAARTRGFKVIATLIDQWGNCGSLDPTGGFKDKGWYETGYDQLDPVGTVSYREWAAEVAARYRNDPTILFWQLANEAEAPDYEGGPCAPDAHAVLKAFAADVSGVVKAADSNHPVSLGTLGNGNCGASYTEWQDLHDIPTIDVCEIHDYYGLGALSGDAFNGTGFRIEQCGALGKPMIIGEVGLRGMTLADRAAGFAEKIAARRGLGVDGELAWAWNKDGSSVTDFDIGPGDPVLGVLEQHGFHYEFSGFRSPVDSPPIVNRAKAGSAIPVKFSLGGGRGLEIFAAGFPAVRTVSCSASAPLDAIEETVAADASRLAYDASADQYVYIWKTDKRVTGCRDLILRFADGYERTARFELR